MKGFHQERWLWCLLLDTSLLNFSDFQDFLGQFFSAARLCWNSARIKGVHHHTRLKILNKLRKGCNWRLLPVT